MLEPDKIVSSLKFGGLLREFENINDHESRIKSAMKALETDLPLPIKIHSKNAEESIKLRKEADQLVVKQKPRNKALLKSLELYTKSIAIAEKSSIELAQAYANRSVTLYYLYKYEECIEDIDRALELSYPDHLRPNILRRKAKCLKIIGNLEAEKVCEQARCLLENVTLSDEKKEDLEIKINNATKVEERPELENITCTPLDSILASFVSHKNIPSATEAIDLKYDKKFGRHFVANRNINAGEIIILEKPYAKLLSHQNIYTYCSHCFVRAWNSIPCDNCIYAVYCTEKCKSEAYALYHDVECKLLHYFVAIKVNEAGPFSLRLVLTAVRESGSIRKLKKELKKVDNCEDYLMKSFSEDGILHSDKYKPVYSLLTHELKRKSFEILTIALNAAITLYYMFKETTFFGENLYESVSSMCENSDALFFGKLFLLHFMSIQINDHEFGELQSLKFVRVGAVIGSVSSFLNHSCNPNVARCPMFRNNTVHQMFYAVHPISKNSPILADYGCHFTSNSRSERDKLLNMYYFHCNCSACNENWPIFNDLPSILSIIKDKETKLTVARSIIRSKKYENTIYRSDINNDFNEHITNIIEQLTASINIVHEATNEPNKEYYELLEAFRLTYCRIFANKFEL